MNQTYAVACPPTTRGATRPKALDTCGFWQIRMRNSWAILNLLPGFETVDLPDAGSLAATFRLAMRSSMQLVSEAKRTLSLASTSL
jgi:hypothetical protein